MRHLLLTLLIGLLAAKTVGVVLRGPVPLERDAFGYWHLSTLVMEGDWLMFSEPIAYRTPVYPWLLASVRWFSGGHSLWVMSLVQGALSVGATVVAGLLAHRITKLPSALPLTLLVSLPAISALTFCAASLTECLFVFLLMLHLHAVLAYSGDQKVGRALWVGVTFALTLLTRPIVLMLWLPHVLFLIALLCRQGDDQTGSTTRFVSSRITRLACHFAAASLVVVVFCTPWLIRNQLLFGQPFLTEFLGRNLWIVTFQDGSGSGLSLGSSVATRELETRLARVGAADQWQTTWAVSNALVESGLSDPAADRLMKRVALDAIEGNGRAFLDDAFRRSVNFWRCAATELPVQGSVTGPYYGYRSWKQDFPPISWAIEHRWSRSVAGNTLLMLAMAAALSLLSINRPTRPPGLWLVMLLAYFSIVTGVLEIPAYRYRMVVEPIVAMVFGSALAVMLSWRRQEAKLLP